VREEIAIREAMTAVLDLDDTVIRRRLRQKFDFLIEDAIEASPPAEDELKAWLGRHADECRTEPRMAFRQVLVSLDRRGATADEALGTAQRTIELDDGSSEVMGYAGCALFDLGQISNEASRFSARPSRSPPAMRRPTLRSARHGP